MTRISCEMKKFKNINFIKNLYENKISKILDQELCMKV
jgi:hypothetical protein